MTTTPDGRLPLPAHFDPRRVGEIWRAPYQERAAEAETWARTHRLRAAEEDTFRVCLVLVDCQNTFCIPGFELFVAGRSGKGAVEDNARLCDFIYRNLGTITQIDATLDTHTAMQIFHSVFLVNEAGAHPPPLTTVSLEDVERGRWKVNPAMVANLPVETHERLQAHLLHYCRKLSEGGKYQLMIWPYHALLGGIGHALVASIEEACFFHALARKSQTQFEIKGNHPLVENYSVIRPEVLEGPDGRRIAATNPHLLERLVHFDAVVIAGQAKSHCVAWTIDDLLGEIRGQAPELANKVYVLEDCTSPVVVPGAADFTEQAEAAFARFGKAGVHIVRSTQPLSEWPGMAR
jgi:nicotinamidase-related amidase